MIFRFFREWRRIFVKQSTFLLAAAAAGAHVVAAQSMASNLGHDRGAPGLMVMAIIYFWAW
jgi:hypothetical protein